MCVCFLNEQSFFYVIPIFGSIKDSESKSFSLFLFFSQSDISSSHCKRPFISLYPPLSCSSRLLITFQKRELLHWKLDTAMNRMYLITTLNFRVIWSSLHSGWHGVLGHIFCSSQQCTNYNLLTTVPCNALWFVLWSLNRPLTSKVYFPWPVHSVKMLNLKIMQCIDFAVL